MNATTPQNASATHAALLHKVCPVAPPGAQVYADQLMGYVLWGVGILFTLGIVVGIGAAPAKGGQA